MIMGATSATHVFKDNGYKYKMSDKKLKYMKKNARKMGSTDYYAKVSKTKKWDSAEKLKIGKKYNMLTGETVKVLKLLKNKKKTRAPGGGYVYKVRVYATMYCWVGYSHGKYSYYADAY